MAQYQILYWKDVPSQVKIYDGVRPRSFQLPEAFQLEIDSLAMKLGLYGTDDYLNQWQWGEKQELPGDGETVRQQLFETLQKELAARRAG